MDLDAGADVPLAPHEVREVQRQLAWVRRYRAVLRLPLNAKEALLVDGAKPPAHRGTAKRLLAKLDRVTLESAIQRHPLRDDGKARAEFLAGAAGISNDPGVLIAWLEAARPVQPRAALARRFGSVVGRIDFADLSESRMVRLLEVMHAAFPDGHDRVQALFGLLRTEGFRSAFDRATERVEASLRADLLPLRAAWDAVEGHPVRHPEALEAGLARLFAGPTDALIHQPVAVRRRLVEAALALSAPWPCRSEGLVQLLASLDRTTPAWRGLSYGRARALVRHDRADEAAAVLRGVLEACPEALEAAALLAWTEAPRRETVAADGFEPGPLRSGYDLRRLRPVWVRVGEPGPLAAEAELQRTLCLPGLCEVAGAGKGWVAVPAVLPRLEPAPLELSEAFALAVDGVRIAAALALAGVRLPDLRSDRFLLERSPYRPRLILADLAGAERDPDAAGPMRGLARRWCRRALAWPTLTGTRLRRELDPAFAVRLETDDASPDFAALVDMLLTAAP